MKWRNPLGFTLIVAGLACAAIAGYTIHTSLENQRLEQVAWDRADRACVAALDQIGEVQNIGTGSGARTAIVSAEVDADWRVTLMNASAAVAFCPTRQMSRFCMGIDCVGGSGATDGGLSQILSTASGQSLSAEEEYRRIMDAKVKMVLAMQGDRP